MTISVQMVSRASNESVTCLLWLTLLYSLSPLLNFDEHESNILDKQLEPHPKVSLKKCKALRRIIFPETLSSEEDQFLTEFDRRWNHFEGVYKQQSEIDMSGLRSIFESNCWLVFTTFYTIHRRSFWRILQLWKNFGCRSHCSSSEKYWLHLLNFKNGLIDNL